MSDQPETRANVMTEARCDLYRERIVQLLAQDIRTILIPLVECAVLVDGVDENRALRARVAELEAALHHRICCGGQRDCPGCKEGRELIRFDET